MSRSNRRWSYCFSALCLAAGCTESVAPESAGTEAATQGSSDEGTTAVAGDDTVASTSGAESSESSGEPEPLDPLSMTIISEVIFYDGYAGVVDEPVADGIIRHSNALYGTQLTDNQLDSIQSTLNMDVWIGALCDNYDRLGGVFLSLVPKGAETYVPAEVTRFEIARFVTPFMNKNKEPTALAFNFQIDDVVPILTDEALRAEFDIWIELEVFGVPYAANTEISGCAGRNDVFLGALELHTDSEREAPEFDFVSVLAARQNFNNHQRGASDELGTTRKTLEFSLDEDTTETQLVLITSNHGANEGGEEYNRREHFVTVDGESVLTYTPGRETCEPFRMYNTQGNGIYGVSPRTPEEWQSFSNWCPGDVIDTRVIDMGPMSAGAHEFVIDVPDAQFVNGEGNFPFSLYIQGR
ncbi:MAG: peptide-N-glycosidase F-related protein [Myxococcota bacterium]